MTTPPNFRDFLAARRIVAPVPRALPSPPPSALTGAMQALAVQQAMQAPPPTVPFVLPPAPSGPPLGELILPNGVMLRNAQGQVMLPPTTPWTPPPGYIEPNPDAGSVVPTGGYSSPAPSPSSPVPTVSPVASPVASPVTSTITTTPATVPVAAPTPPVTPLAGMTTTPGGQPIATTPTTPPLVPASPYVAGQAVPSGSSEFTPSADGSRQVVTPDGAVWVADYSSDLATPGVQPPTGTLTIIPGTGVVQAPGGTGQAPAVQTPEQIVAALPPEQQATLSPYVAEMNTTGQTPDQYLTWQQTRADEARGQVDTLNQQLLDLDASIRNDYRGYAPPSVGQQRQELAAQIDAATQNANTMQSYATTARVEYGNAGLAGDAEVTGIGAVTGAVGSALDAARGEAVTGVGNLLVEAANNPGAAQNEALQTLISGPAMPGGGDNGSLFGFALDPREAAQWAAQWAAQNPDLVNSAAANGYDADGDGAPDFTGGRAVWELYAGTRAWYERAGADILLDPLTYVGGVATIGRRIAGEAPEAATAVRAAVGTADNAAAPVVTTVDDAAAAARAVPTTLPVAPVVPVAATTTTRTLPTVRQVVGGALQVPDLIVNRGADRITGAALGVAGDVARNTPGLSWLTGQSDRVRAEVSRDETLAAADRATALQRRSDEFSASRLTPDRPLPGEEADALVASGNPDALASRTYDAQGQPVDPVTDPLTARQATDAASETTDAIDPLDQAFREATRLPWRQSREQRAELFRGGIIQRRVGRSASPGQVEAGRTFVELVESAWRSAGPETLADREFRSAMADAEAINGRVGRSGDRSQQLDVAWKRTPEPKAVPVSEQRDVAGNPLSPSPRPGGSVEARAFAQPAPATVPSAGTSGAMATPTTPASSLSAPATTALTWTRPVLDDLPLGDADRQHLSEVLPGTGTHEQQSMWSRFTAHLDDARDLGMGEAEAVTTASQRLGADYLASRGIRDKVPNWFDRLSQKVATGVLYKPTTLIRRVIGDAVTDIASATITGNADALPRSFDPRLIAEGVQSQGGAGSAGKAFGRSDSSKLISDLGMGTRWRGELTAQNLGVDRGTGLAKRGTVSRRQQQTLVEDEPGLGQRARSAAGRLWSGVPRDVINGTSAARRAALYTQTVSDGLPVLVRNTRDQAIETATRHGLDTGQATDIADRALAGLRAEMQAAGRQGFDAVELGQRLRSEAETTLGGRQVMTVGQSRRVNDWATETARRYQDATVALDGRALDEVNRVFFSYRPTRIDEGLSRGIWFSYYATRASKLYVTEGLKNPAIAANYFRAQEGQQRAAEEGGYPAPVRGFFELLNSDLGYSMYWNPTAMLSSYLTFRDQAGVDGQGRNLLEKALDYSPGMVNPLIETGLNVIGALPDTLMSDPLATHVERRLAGNALNWGRARGYLPGQADGMLDAPYQDVLDNIRSAVSGVVSPFAPGLLEQVEATSQTASSTRQFHDILLTIAESRYPDDPERALDEAAAAMFEPDSELYQAAYREQTEGQLATSLTNVVLPIQARMRPTNADDNTALIDQTREQNPTLTNAQLSATDPAYDRAVYERTLISTDSPIDAALVAGEQRSGNVGTPEQRQANATYNTIAHGDAASIAALAPAGVTIGGVVYTPAQIAATPPESRYTIADTYAVEHGQAEAVGAYRTNRDAFLAASPEYDQYRQWQGGVFTEADATAGGDVVAWADRIAETNPTFATHWRAERDRITASITDPAQQRSYLESAATSEDSYLSYLGRRSDLYAPDPQPLTGPMGMPGGAAATGGQQTTTDPRQQLDEQIAAYQTDNVIADTVLRNATGSPDITYQGIDFPGGQNVADRILQRSGLTPPRMGSLLNQYSSWVAGLTPGAPRDISTFLLLMQTPQTADPTDALRSQYGQP